MILNGESRTLELKKSTGELKEAMHTACAFLNGDGGWLIFGVTPDSLRTVGQKVTDNTRREIAQALALLEPAVDVRAEYIEIPDSKGENQLVAIHFDGMKENHVPYTCNGCPYYKLESTTRQMPREMYDELLRRSNPEKFAWDAQVADGVSIADLSEERMVDLCREQGLREPEYQSDGYMVKITFWKNTRTDSETAQMNIPKVAEIMQKDAETMQKAMQKDSETMQKAMQKKLQERNIKITERQLDILVYFALNPFATRNDYIHSDASISEGGTKSNIERLLSIGLLRREGGRKSGHWVVLLNMDEE